MLTDELKRDYRAASLTLCSAILGLIFMRLIVYFSGLPSATYGQELAQNALFALCTQLVFFLAIPFCLYKFYGGRTVKQTLEYSSAGKFRPSFLLAVPMGVGAYILTVGVSSAWAGLLRLTGYNTATSSAPMPDNFVIGYFIADMLLTAVLPAVCEEFCMRGGLLTTAQRSYKPTACIIICAVAFGLFHQNIKQVFYTALFGALAAHLIIKHKSLYPAVLLHFTNNFCSVLTDYSRAYGWFGGGLNAMLAHIPVWALALMFLAAGALVAGMCVLMAYIREKSIIDKKREILKDCAFDATNKRVILPGEFDAERVKQLEMEQEVYGSDYAPQRLKPRLRDAAVIVALGVVALLTTVFTYVWGFFY